MKRYVSFGCRQLGLSGADRELWSKRMVARFGAQILPQLPEIRDWSLILQSRSRGPIPDRKNCWEFMACGKEEGGKRAGRLGICPASTATGLHAIHGGMNAGRACWTIEGTLCRKNSPESLGEKKAFCQSCSFYRVFLSEEHPHLIVSDEMLLTLLQ
jgi:hypothetical protein